MQDVDAHMRGIRQPPLSRGWPFWPPMFATTVSCQGYLCSAFDLDVIGSRWCPPLAGWHAI